MTQANSCTHPRDRRPLTPVFPAAFALLFVTLFSSPTLADLNHIPPAERELARRFAAGLTDVEPLHSIFPQTALGDPEDIQWWGGFGPQRVGNAVLAATLFEGDLIVGGDFVTASDTGAAHVARWNGANWEPMGMGFDESVYTLAVWNDQLVAGGFFEQSGDTELSRVAIWDGSDWQPMGSGFDASVLVLESVNGELYAGGWFENLGDDETEALHIARWTGATWEPVGGGLSGGASAQVSAIAEYQGQLVVGGSFNNSAQGSLSNLALWNGSEWQNVGGGTNDRVFALEFLGSSLYAGGLFTEAGSTPARRVARYDGKAWEAINIGMDSSVLSITSFQDQIYAGGLFGIAGDTTAVSVARLEIENLGEKNEAKNWVSVGTGMNGGVTHLIPFGDRLIATGIFTESAGSDIDFVASFQEDTWGSLGSTLDGLVSSLVVHDGRLVVGGSFTNAGGLPANRIAGWDGFGWSSYADGFDGPVEALAVHEGELYAGGVFGVPDTNGVGLAYAAKWNAGDQVWEKVGGGFDGPVFDLLSWDGRLYAGGDFQEADGNTADNIAVWDGSTWSDVGDGVNATVFTMTNYQNQLVAAGLFSRAGDQLVTRIARFDGTVWSGFGRGIQGDVKTAARYRGDLVVGGDFPTADTLIVNAPLARWDGAGWVGLETEFLGNVESLYSTGVELMVGGTFSATTEGGTAFSLLSYSVDGTETVVVDNLGSGLDGEALAFALYQDALFVGGDFFTAGGKSSPYLARWDDVQVTPVRLAELRIERSRAADGSGPATGGLVQWTVSDALDHAGFHVYRGDTSADGLLTSQMLRSADGRYEFWDADAPLESAFYWLEEISTSGHSSWFGPFELPASTANDGLSVGHAFEMEWVGPRPFRDQTSFRIAAGERLALEVSVFDVRGRRVRELFRGSAEDGDVIAWDGRADSGNSVAPGLYFVRAVAPSSGFTRTARLVRVK